MACQGNLMKILLKGLREADRFLFLFFKLMKSKVSGEKYAEPNKT